MPDMVRRVRAVRDSAGSAVLRGRRAGALFGSPGGPDVVGDAQGAAARAPVTPAPDSTEPRAPEAPGVPGQATCDVTT